MTRLLRLVIIPTFNERENMPEIAPHVLSAFEGLHLLVVDDDSPDGTADLMEERFGSDPCFHLLRRNGLRGLGRSYVDGYRWAMENGFEQVIQMDADFSHNPTYIPSLIEAAEECDVVIGSRYCPGGGVRDWPRHRELLSRFANRYVAAITGIPVRDATAGFRCYSRRALRRIQIDTIESNGYAFQVEMTWRAMRAGLKIQEVPIVFSDRTKGKSKLSRKVMLESMISPWKLRFRSFEALEDDRVLVHR